MHFALSPLAKPPEMAKKELKDEFDVDHAIADALISLMIRVEKSDRRALALAPSPARCCISGISEACLLVARHTCF